MTAEQALAVALVVADGEVMSGTTALTPSDIGHGGAMLAELAAQGYSLVPTADLDRLRADLRARVGTNLRVYQHRVDNGTATDFDRGKRAAFQVVLSMLDDRPHEPAFSCGRAALGDRAAEEGR